MFGKFCLRVLVGTLVICLFGGAGVLAMAVVCTYGIGLIVVVPAAYLIGLFCTIWFIPFGNRSKDSKGQNLQSPDRLNVQPTNAGLKHSPHGCSALHDYIAGAESKGQDWQDIRTDLIEMGWAAEMVDTARKGLGQIKKHDCW